MKKIIKSTFFTILLIIIFSACAYAGDVDITKEPKKFRGIPWKTHIRDVDGMVLLQGYPRENARKDYRREGDKLFIGDIEIASPRYVFYNDEFREVVIDFKYPKQTSEVIKVFRGVFGEESYYDYREITTAPTTKRIGNIVISKGDIGNVYHVKWDFPKVGIEIISAQIIRLNLAGNATTNQRDNSFSGVKSHHILLHYKGYEEAAEKAVGDL